MAGVDMIYRLKITLANSRPTIWRRVEVTAGTSLGELHRVIQGVMGWEEAHLHEFVFGKSRRPTREDVLAWDAKGGGNVAELWGERHYSDPVLEMEQAEDEWGVTLGEAAPAVKTKFTYLYDFGDGWEHQVVVEKIESAGKGASYPRCTGGARRAPMEDSGGIWGWMDKVRRVNSGGGGDDPDYDDLRGWMGLKEGETIETDDFDVGEANARMVKVMRMCDEVRSAELRRRKRGRT